MLAVALICFLVSELTRNYSQVDKLWSIMPIIYSVMALASYPGPRLWIMSSLVTVWGFRLSFNFYRKGGYSIIPWKGEEDYRWKYIRQNPLLRNKLRFTLFNLFFISIYQNLLIFLFSSPVLIAAMYQNSPLTLIDLIVSCLMLTFIIIESISDNQQFRFQKLKRQSNPSEEHFRESLRKGFICEGLWRYVRHPNFISEQAIWISFYFFGVAATGQWINLSLAGPVLLALLFLGSTSLTEHISSEKYPGYTAYKHEVPKYFPRIFKS
jgi:steroid 5-alpha reductase family enzyme